MAVPVLTVTLIGGTTVTVTLQHSGWTGKTWCENISKIGGFFDDAGAWHPATAILSVAIA